jgi:hypothetical protein
MADSSDNGRGAYATQRSEYRPLRYEVQSDAGAMMPTATPEQ